MPPLKIAVVLGNETVYPRTSFFELSNAQLVASSFLWQASDWLEVLKALEEAYHRQNR